MNNLELEKLANEIRKSIIPHLQSADFSRRKIL